MRRFEFGGLAQRQYTREDIDPDSRLADELCGLFYFQDGITRNIAGIEAESPRTFPYDPVSGRFGAGSHFDGTDSNAAKWTNRELIKTSDGIGTGDFSAAVICRFTNAATAAVIANNRYSAGPEEQWRFQGNNPASGDMAFITYETAFTNTEYSHTNDEEWHVWTFTRVGTLHTLYRDGVEVANTTGTVRAVWRSGAGGMDLEFGSFAAHSGIDFHPNDIHSFYAWNRGLAEPEIILHARSPELIIKPDRLLAPKAPVGVAPDVPLIGPGGLIGAGGLIGTRGALI